MQLSGLDGFLTAIAIGPDLIKPSEWLPVVWGSDEDANFESNHQAQLVRGDDVALQRHIGFRVIRTR